MKRLEELPGIVPMVDRGFLYLESESPDSFRHLFPTIACSAGPALPTHGGILNEEAIIVLSSGERFFGVSFRGDLKNWEKKVNACAEANGLRVGRIVEGHLILSDERVVPLESCKIMLDQ